MHYNNVTNLGGMLVLVLKTDPRQRQNRENFCDGCVCSKLNASIT